MREILLAVLVSLLAWAAFGFMIYALVKVAA